MSEHNFPTTDFDIVIAGGGLSGALSALALAKLTAKNSKPLSIAIIDINPITTDVSLSYDDRVLALAHSTCQYFKQLGVWPLIEQSATPIETIHISDRGNYGKARINAEEHQVCALGYVVEMAVIGQSLLTQLKQYSNVHWCCPEKISAISWQQDSVNIQLASDKILNAKLLLACDGGQSVCRQQANIQTSERDYHQAAIIANVSTAKPHDNIAFERFTENGPIAMLPLSNDRCSLVWTLSPEQSEQIIQLDDKEFAQQLTQHFGGYLGPITHVGKRSVFPLRLVKAQQQVFHRMVLVGNASHTIHPIAGQGFNLGVRDVIELEQLIANALTDTKENTPDIGSFAMLQQYQQQRGQDQKSVIELTDSLVTLFSNQLFPLVVGRNIGLKVINYCNKLQEKFVSKTMGY